MKRLIFLLTLFSVRFMQASSEPKYDVDDVQITSVDLNTLEATRPPKGIDVSVSQVMKDGGQYLVAIKTQINGCNCEYLYCSNLRPVSLALSDYSEKNPNKCYKPKVRSDLNPSRYKINKSVLSGDMTVRQV